MNILEQLKLFNAEPDLAYPDVFHGMTSVEALNALKQGHSIVWLSISEEPTDIAQPERHEIIEVIDGVVCINGTPASKDDTHLHVLFNPDTFRGSSSWMHNWFVTDKYTEPRISYTDKNASDYLSDILLYQFGFDKKIHGCKGENGPTCGSCYCSDGMDYTELCDDRPCWTLCPNGISPTEILKNAKKLMTDDEKQKIKSIINECNKTQYPIQTLKSNLCKKTPKSKLIKVKLQKPDGTKFTHVNDVVKLEVAQTYFKLKREQDIRNPFSLYNLCK